MKERGMIFNGEMVLARLDGRKTQTRRPVKLPHTDRDAMCELSGNELAGELSAGNYRNSPHGKPGDRIWVRETFQGPLFDFDLMDSYCKDPTPFERPEFCVYKADGAPAPEFYDADDELHCRWRPSIHMPRWASRILLEITDVRVERLNAISQEDAQAEGMELTGWRPTYSDPDSGGEVMTPYDNFAELWSSIYGDESWKANGWVWVISFKRVEGGAA
ncbi:morphogenetic protein [Citrobacter freundii]|uniref:morphogenetic protein n=1 Tax=Citrobacter freundii TaxID=546 RepID=UPI0024C1B8F5|nr:morphogenetic protein [Citrobacter freundii]WHW83753.1 morphogenetic protein [Citrobacter freundii]WHW93597.1 morphogenetic protein [Citrobacter freundii]